MVIALKNDDLELQFKTFGGELSSIRSKEGIEYLWQGDPEYWSGQIGRASCRERVFWVV